MDVESLLQALRPLSLPFEYSCIFYRAEVSDGTCLGYLAFFCIGGVAESLFHICGSRDVRRGVIIFLIIAFHVNLQHLEHTGAIDIIADTLEAVAILEHALCLYGYSAKPIIGGMIDHVARIGEQLRRHRAGERDERVLYLNDIAIVVVMIEPYHVFMKLVGGSACLVLYVARCGEAVAIVCEVGILFVDERVEGE